MFLKEVWKLSKHTVTQRKLGETRDSENHNMKIIGNIQQKKLTLRALETIVLKLVRRRGGDENEMRRRRKNKQKGEMRSR